MRLAKSFLPIGICFALLAFTGAAAQSQGDAQEIPDQSGLHIRTPSLKGRETLKLKLSNGLQAYLISDPGAEQSAAALRVDVGSFQDPDSRPGMAHFIEHMLFLGTGAYPEEGGFRKYVEDHGGYSNACTSDTYTLYMFSVNTDAFPESLDRFAHFFVDPLLTSSAIGREQQAIDQEFERAVEDDDWRQLMVQKELANPDHPFARFGAGNSKTLEGISSEEARSWYQAHYSANIMHLVVYSPLPLRDLKALVVQDFKPIPDRDVQPFSTPIPKVAKGQEGSAIYITPHKTLRNATLVWELPYDYPVDSETHAADLIAYVLGHEGPGSLLATLKAEGLAEGIQAGSLRHKRAHSAYFDFYISLDLTAKGLKSRDTVVTRVFQAIKALREEGIPEYLHKEDAQLRERQYSYQTRTDPYKAVSNLIRQMGNEELETFPRLTTLPTRYDDQAIQNILEELTPEAMQLFITGKPSETRRQHDQTERWMEASYHVEKIDPNTLSKWRDAKTHKDITLPPPNPYTPDELSIRCQGPCLPGLAKVERLIDNDQILLYYAQDKQFLVPEIGWEITIKSAAVQPQSAESAALNELLVRCTREALAEDAYLAAMAGLKYSLTPTDKGVRIKVAGYNDKAPLLLERILKSLYSQVPSEAAFALCKECLLRDYNNASKRPPIEQALELTSRMLRRDYVTDSECARSLRRIDHERLARFYTEFAANTFCEAMLFGNLSKPEAEEVGALIVESFPSAPSPESAAWRPFIAQLPKEGGPFFLEKKTSARGNAIVLTLQEGPFTFKRRAAQELLAQGIETPFFMTLRTEQQTGYLVTSWAQEVERQLFGFFAVQSNSHEGRDLLARFELMIESFLRDLRDSELPQERFEEMKQALITRLSEPPRNPAAMARTLAELAFQYDGQFDWYEQRIAGVQGLSYSEFEVLAREYLGRGNKRRLAVLIEGKVPPVTTLHYRKIRSPVRMKQLADFFARDNDKLLP